MENLKLKTFNEEYEEDDDDFMFTQRQGGPMNPGV